jgi:hypothetical protein
MASYMNSSYFNSFYDLTGVYFNSTNQSRSSSSVNLDELELKYLIKSSGGTISINLIVSGSVDIQTSLTIPNIGNVENPLDGKQDLINDGDLPISKTLNLQTTLTNLYTNITENTSDITTLNKNNLIYNSKEYSIKALSTWNNRTIPTGNWKKIIWVDELNLLIGISISTSGNRMMTSSNGIDWEYVVDSPSIALQDIVWSPELSLLVAVANTSLNTTPAIYTSSDAITWTSRTNAIYQVNALGNNVTITVNSLTSVAWSPDLNLFASISKNGRIITSPEGINWTYRGQPNGLVDG